MLNAKLALLLLLFCGFCHSAYTQSIKFEKTAWDEVVQKARTEKKLIFVDVYTKWCVPCKQLNTYFADEKVARVYNTNFVNYSFDAEAANGPFLAKQFAVKSYPTCLYIDPHTQSIVFRTQGLPQDKETFIINAYTAMSEQKNQLNLDGYAYMFQHNLYDEALLKSYIKKSTRAEMNNDHLIDAYVMKYVSPQQSMADSTFNFLKDNLLTLHNSAYGHLFKQSNRVPKQSRVLFLLSHQLIMREIKSGIAATDAKFCATLDTFKRYNQSVDLPALYQLEYLLQNGSDQSALLKNFRQWATLAAQIDLKELNERDGILYDNFKAQLEERAKMNGMSLQTKMTFIENETALHPTALHTFSNRYADLLSKAAAFYFDAPKQITLSEALVWSKKAVEFSIYADAEQKLACRAVYAHLLSESGQVAEAIQGMSMIVEAASNMQSERLEEYKKLFKQMQKRR